MPTHKIIIQSVTPQCDLKQLVHSISDLKGCATNQAIDWVKNLPLTLFSNCSEKQSREIVEQFEQLGAHIICQPPLNAPQKSPQIKRRVTHKTTKKDLKSTWSISAGIIIALCVLGLAVMIPTINWVYQATRTPEEKSLRASKTGSALIGQKRYSEASSLLRNSIKDNPYNTSPYITEAINLISQARNQMDESKWSEYGIPKKNRSREPGGYDNLPETGIDRLPLPEASKALHILKKALSLEPNNPEIYRWLGYIYQQKGLFNNAKVNLEKAAALSPKSILYKNILGNLFIETEQYAKADYLFREALALDTTNIHTLKNLGLLNQFHLNDTGLAQHYYYRYMQQNPSQQNDFDINIIKKELMMIVWSSFNRDYFPQQGAMNFSKYETERVELEDELKRVNTAETTEKLALLFARNGKFNEAKDYFQKALIIDPKQISVYSYLAILHASHDELPITIMMLNQALQRGSKDPFVFKNLALYEKYYSNNREEAQKYYDRYIKYGADDFRSKMMQEFSH